tara:strand:- start:356 stop:1045 length:690 start_codon:yes stop_codon:yes gene_type:complete
MSDIITRLSAKPFVHIIAQARSGSTALYDSLQWPHGFVEPKITKQRINLSEKLKGPVSKEHLNKICAMVKDYEKNGLRTMKNLLQDILRYDKRSQNKLFKLPVYNVGLTRRNTFEQTCSEMLHDMDKAPVGTLDQKYVIDHESFMRNLLAILREKKAMFNYKEHYDELINYEDIVFPPHIVSSWSPPKQLRIINYQEVKEWYREYMQKSKHVEIVQSAGVNWSIDKTNK